MIYRWPRAGFSQPVIFALVSLVVAACNSSNDDDGFAANDIRASGIYTVMSDGVEREFYVQLPSNYQRTGEPRPLLIAIHGSGDSIEGWFAGGFQGDGLLNLAKDDAIMVIPNGTPDAGGRRQWDPTSDRDYNFFLDMLAELDQRVTYDVRRIFVTGHSAGGLMAHGLGCRYGDIFRAIAPSAATLLEVTFSCTGSVAVLQIQGEFDEVQTPQLTTDTRDNWAQYNGFDKDVFAPVEPAPCVDYSANSLLYPVRWCLHDTREQRGHAWWSGADQAVWDFFTRLEIVEPTLDPPPNGGNDKVIPPTTNTDTTLTITIEFPEGVGEPVRSGLFLFPADTQLPIAGAPLEIMNPDIDFPDVSPGVRTYEFPAQLPDDSKLPATYTLGLAVYIFGTFPIPVAGIDHLLIVDITINDSTTDIVVPGVQLLAPVELP